MPDSAGLLSVSGKPGNREQDFTLIRKESSAMQTFVINLKRHEKRKVSISSQCEKYGLNYKIINAIDGNDLPEEILNSVTWEYYKCHLSKGEIGCALSHLHIYSSILASNLDYALILEDDAVLNEELIPNLTTISTIISNKKAEIFLLSQADAVNRYIRKKTSPGKFYYRLSYGSGGHAYIINNIAARKIIECNLPVKFEADRWTDFRESIGLKVWCCEKSIINTSASLHEKSSLEAERNSNRDKRSAYRHRIKKMQKFYQLKRFRNVIINRIGKINSVNRIIQQQ
ncbi:glycosyltransferase family 25 protein [Erwinia papayae]|uniref:Glycosyltransferase family 25 protein n=1 Tax=Erwinia papayae TaxID=206499 RepID=A0ABV3N2Y7_9GAMM